MEFIEVHRLEGCRISSGSSSNTLLFPVGKVAEGLRGVKLRWICWGKRERGWSLKLWVGRVQGRA